MNTPKISKVILDSPGSLSHVNAIKKEKILKAVEDFRRRLIAGLVGRNPDAGKHQDAWYHKPNTDPQTSMYSLHAIDTLATAGIPEDTDLLPVHRWMSDTWNRIAFNYQCVSPEDSVQGSRPNNAPLLTVKNGLELLNDTFDIS